MHLVVGLGNPGKTYEHTRHNVGFMVVDRLAGANSITVKGKRFFSLWGRGDIADHKVILAKPQAFMNRSGQGVHSLMAYFKVDVKELLVIHDDLDVDFGKIKIVHGGGDGGHRGVQAIHQTLGEDRYARVKVGIGRPRFAEAVEDYVLSPWYEDQGDHLGEIVDTAAAAVTAILARGLERAMTEFNSKHVP